MQVNKKMEVNQFYLRALMIAKTIYFSLLIVLILIIGYLKQNSLQILMAVLIIHKFIFLASFINYLNKSQPISKLLIKVVLNHIYLEEFNKDYPGEDDLLLGESSLLMIFDLIIIRDLFYYGEIFEKDEIIQRIKFILFILGILCKSLLVLITTDQLSNEDSSRYRLFRIFNSFIGTFYCTGLFLILLKDLELFVFCLQIKLLSSFIEILIIYANNLEIYEVNLRQNIMAMFGLLFPKIYCISIDYILEDVRMHQFENNFLKEISIQMSVPVLKIGQYVENIIYFLLIVKNFQPLVSELCFKLCFIFIVFSLLINLIIGLIKITIQLKQFFTKNYYYYVDERMEYEDIANILEKSKNINLLIVRSIKSPNRCSDQVKDIIFQKIIQNLNQQKYFMIQDTITSSITEFEINQQLFFNNIIKMILKERVLPLKNFLKSRIPTQLIQNILILRFLKYGYDQNFYKFQQIQEQEISGKSQYLYLSLMMPIKIFHREIAPNLSTNPLEICYDLYDN